MKKIIIFITILLLFLFNNFYFSENPLFKIEKEKKLNPYTGDCTREGAK